VRVVIIDYGSGNLRSAAKAFERAIADGGLGMSVVVTADPRQVLDASHIVLPGVGAFGDCRQGLDRLPGMVEALDRAVRAAGRPFLGICVGMQLLAEVGREHGEHPGLGWIAGEVTRLNPDDPRLKIPHMGWNDLRLIQPAHPVLRGIAPGAHAYFVHSYAFRPRDPTTVLAEVDYGGAIAAIIGRETIVGTQFHPEKSQATGLTFIGNFLRWRP
jgi:glutamine amidotransferase